MTDHTHDPTPRKFAATIRIGSKGQIVIPKTVRDMFGYEPGDEVLLLADTERGIAIAPASAIANLIPEPGEGT